jgi:hypothetical protein
MWLKVCQPCLQLLRSEDGALVDLTTLWNPEETAVVAFARSFG